MLAPPESLTQCFSPRHGNHTCITGCARYMRLRPRARELLAARAVGLPARVASLVVPLRGAHRGRSFVPRISPKSPHAKGMFKVPQGDALTPKPTQETLEIHGCTTRERSVGRKGRGRGREELCVARRRPADTELDEHVGQTHCLTIHRTTHFHLNYSLTSSIHAGKTGDRHVCLAWLGS